MELIRDITMLYAEHPITMGAITMALGVVVAAIGLIIGRK